MIPLLPFCPQVSPFLRLPDDVWIGCACTTVLACFLIVFETQLRASCGCVSQRDLRNRHMRPLDRRFKISYTKSQMKAGGTRSAEWVGGGHLMATYPVCCRMKPILFQEATHKVGVAHRIPRDVICMMTEPVPSLAAVMTFSFYSQSCETRLMTAWYYATIASAACSAASWIGVLMLWKPHLNCCSMAIYMDSKRADT